MEIESSASKFSYGPSSKSPLGIKSRLETQSLASKFRKLTDNFALWSRGLTSPLRMVVKGNAQHDVRRH